ncbi:MAG: hypothetical protein ACYTEU_04210 [Planctomycetota bacterium]|jgi:hypothetical protein
MNDFSTIFVITEETCIQEPYYWGLLGIVVGISLLFFLLQKKIANTIGYLLSFISIIWGLIFFGATLDWQLSYNKSLDNFISLYNDKKYDITEGIVHVQYRGKKEGHDGGDKITIDGKHFRQSHFRSTPAYQESIVYGGVLRDGVYVRVYYNDGNILRIDKMNLEIKNGKN